MLILAGSLLLLYVLSATACSARLLWVVRRTRRAPELLLGAGVLLVTTVSLPLSLASGFGGAADRVHVGLWGVSELITQVGILCLYGFAQQTFRPAVGWARGIVGAAALVMPIALAGALRGLAAAPPGTLSVAATGAWLLVCHLGYAGAFVWTAIEAFAHFGRARRRLALGLADPVVTNRFALIAIYGVACTGISLANAAAVVLERNIATSLVVVLPAGLLAPVASGAMLLAILPPAWYQARLRAATGLRTD
ncbi:MAG: hypothetical protein OZ948_14840 [Deltaproteobacteria bacterium]|nr:hypothetical protein [Deltaproteobacteria bacterium]